VAAVCVRQQRHDHPSLAVRSRRQNDALVGPFHEVVYDGFDSGALGGDRRPQPWRRRDKPKQESRSHSLAEPSPSSLSRLPYSSLPSMTACRVERDVRDIALLLATDTRCFPASSPTATAKYTVVIIQ
jgi:hypothetical protein